MTGKETMKAFFGELNDRFTQPMNEWAKKEYGKTIEELIDHTNIPDNDLLKIAQSFRDNDGINCLADIWEFLEDLARWH